MKQLIIHTLMLAAALAAAQNQPEEPSVGAELTEGFEFCVTHPAPGEFELWVRHGGAEHAGLAGFNATILGDITTFHFDSLEVALSGPGPATRGFDVLGAGRTAAGFNIYGVQTRRSSNLPVFGLSLFPLSIPGVEGPVEFKTPLRLGSGTYSGTSLPILDHAALAGNAFEMSETGQTFATMIASCCSAASGDQDGDGLPDCWELEFFGNTTDGDPDEDTDGDGQTNGEEYVAGTDPLVSNAPMAITSIRHHNGIIELTFPTTPFREYQVQYTPSLSQPDGWTNLAPGLIGDGQPVVVRDPDPAGSSRFYRVVIRQP